MPENIKHWYFNNPGIKYSIFMILVIIFLNCFLVRADSLKILLVALYYGLSIKFILAMLKAAEDKVNIGAALVLPFLMLLTIESVWFLPAIGILLFYIKSTKWRVIQRISLGLYIFVFGVIGLLAFFFSGAVKITEQEYPSPNNGYIMIFRESDQGALGGDIRIVVHRNAAIINRFSDIKEIYKGRWGERPNMFWLDNETILINGKRIDILEK